MDYFDFDLEIARHGNGYAASVLDSPAGEVTQRFVLPFSEPELEELVFSLGGVRRKATKEIPTSITRSAHTLGGGLFEAVFDDEVLACFRTSFNQASGRNCGLRVRIRLQQAPELMNVPWEFLFDQNRGAFLAQSKDTPIVRYLAMPGTKRPFEIDGPINILVMISSPTEPRYPQLNVERERALIEGALRPLEDEGRVRLEVLEDARASTLQDRLMREAYHIFHYIGHSYFDQEKKEGALLLEGEGGKGKMLTAPRLGALLQDHNSLRLVVLNSCEGARGSVVDPFSSIASSLIQRGIPAVIAMQFEITDGAAITFSRAFYTAASHGLTVDAALSEARKGVYVLPNEVEWGTPVLYSRAGEGKLFSFGRDETAAHGEAGFDIAGDWVATYVEHGTGTERLEDVHVEQDATDVKGTITRQDRAEPPWHFSGEIRSGSFNAFYKSREAFGHHSGTFSLSVVEPPAVQAAAAGLTRATALSGSYTGFELALGAQVGSTYVWKRAVR